MGYNKIMERVINNRIIWWTETYNIVDPNQRGFRKRKGYLENLTDIVIDSKKALFKKKVP